MLKKEKKKEKERKKEKKKKKKNDKIDIITRSKSHLLFFPLSFFFLVLFGGVVGGQVGGLRRE